MTLLNGTCTCVSIGLPIQFGPGYYKYLDLGTIIGGGFEMYTYKVRSMCREAKHHIKTSLCKQHMVTL